MLTLAQRKALDVRRNLSVTANAGSGKTLVLVQRFLNILLGDEGVPPERIVAITFTDKAAAELRSRIVNALDELLRSAPDDDRFRAARQSVGDAFIGTIHSFCRTLLRSYPLEAGVDADFMVLDSTEAWYLRREAVNETLLHALDESSDAAGLRRALLLRYGRDGVERVLDLLIDARDTHQELLASYRRDDDSIIAGWNSAVEAELQSVCDAAPVAELIALAAMKSGKRSTALAAALAGIDRSPGIREHSAALRAVIDCALKKDGKGLFVELIPADAGAEWVASLTARVQETDEGLNIYDWDDDPAAHAARLHSLLADARVFLDLVDDALQRYDARKDERGALDFDDLQLLTVNVLRDERVLEEVRSEFTHYLVDEFQDTNRLQFALIDMLTDGVRRGNVCIVGDPKQSIYGFRGADVGVFQEARQVISARGNAELPFGDDGEELESTADERSGAILLAESFRMLPGIAGIVNHIFGQAMARDSVGYDPIVATRESPVNDAAVESILVDDDGDEADWVARRLVELFSANASAVRVERDKAAATPEPRDVAILLRTRRGLPALEQALFRRGVPYTVSGGIGFYGRQEILDVCNYLRFLVTPSDDIACAAVLRSPFYHVTDADLFMAARENANAGPSFWSRVSAYADAHPGSHSHGAVTMLRSHLASAHRVTPTELIATIQSDTRWHGIIEGHPQVAQVRANVEKLVARVHDVQRRGFNTLYDVVEALDRFAANADTEGQAQIVSDGNVVHIMTVHAAKGLEFPIVVLPFLRHNEGRSKQEFLDRSLGLAFSQAESGAEDTEIFRLAKARARRRADEEERRVLYVACTRARDALVLSMSRRSKSSVWSAAIERAIPAPVDGAQWVEHPGGRVRLITSAPEATTMPSQTPNAGMMDEALPDVFVERLASEPYGEFFSASHFVTHRQCPTKYLLRYVLGAPEDFRPHVDPDLNGDERIYGSARGIATHAVLARIDELPPEQLRNAADEEIANLGLDADDAARLSQTVAGLAATVLEYPAWQAVMAMRPAFAEYELAASVGKEFVHGVIDRLVRGDDGIWHVVDFKTDSITAENLSDKTAAYELQLQVYAFLVLTHVQEARCVDAHLWFLQRPDATPPRRYARSELPALRSGMEDLVAGITATQRAGAGAARIRSHCAQCGFHRRVQNAWACILD